MKITHYDLFAGIGGFSLALDTIFYEKEIKHIFCEWEAFPTAVLRKHWPEGTYYGDIADLVADTNASRLERERAKQQTDGDRPGNSSQNVTILTGGFPCQPFSHAGRRQGTADDRYKWPEMFAVIKNVRPDWVIAENVAGLNSMVQYGSDTELEEKTYPTEQDARAACEKSHTEGQGYRTGNGVLGTVVGDLEREGYSVQTFIIPAVAVGAPHRRERVWIVANHKSTRAGENVSGLRRLSERYSEGEQREGNTTASPNPSRIVAHRNSQRECDGSGEVQETNGEVPKRNDDAKPSDTDRSATPNPRQQLREQGGSKGVEAGTTIGTTRSKANQREHQYTWADDWREVAFATCHDGVDDGLPRRMDGATLRGKRTDSISASKHRKERLKACGNAIVPQVAMEIFRAIKKQNDNRTYY